MAKFVEISTEGIFSRTFRNEKGNTDLCKPTVGNYVSLKTQQIGG